MSDVLSPGWTTELRDWGIKTSQSFIESWLFGKKKTPAPSPSPDAVGSSGLKKWLPYALIGAALVAVLLFFKGKK